MKSVCAAMLTRGLVYLFTAFTYLIIGKPPHGVSAELLNESWVAVCQPSIKCHLIDSTTEQYIPLELTTASTMSETSSVRDISIAWIGDGGTAADVPGAHTLLPECTSLAAAAEQEKEEEVLGCNLLTPAVAKNMQSQAYH